MVEKRLTFEHENARYFFASAVPSETHPSMPGITRLEMIFQVNKFSVSSDKQSIIFESLIQTDFKLGSGALAKTKLAVILNAMPFSIKAWNK